MLKAISVSSCRPAKPPIWNPKLLLQYMTMYNINENNLYQVSRHTATLLLLSSGRRVHDLTLLGIDIDNLIDEGNAIVLWPIFGSKTDNVNCRQSGWRLKEHPVKQLNMVFWIKRLLHVSSDKRNSINNLFITATGVVRPASRTVIGNWIKSLLQEAGINAPPGSIRSAVASLNWIEKFPIDQILATGNWRQEHTFQNYYRKEMINDNLNNNNNESVSLSNYFVPVR